MLCSAGCHASADAPVLDRATLTHRPHSTGVHDQAAEHGRAAGTCGDVCGSPALSSCGLHITCSFSSPASCFPARPTCASRALSHCSARLDSFFTKAIPAHPSPLTRWHTRATPREDAYFASHANRAACTLDLSSDGPGFAELRHGRLFRAVACADMGAREAPGVHRWGTLMASNNRLSRFLEFIRSECTSTCPL